MVKQPASHIACVKSVSHNNTMANLKQQKQKCRKCLLSSSLIIDLLKFDEHTQE